MPDELRDPLVRLVDRLVALAEGDEQVRSDLHSIAKAVMLLTMPAPPEAAERIPAPAVIEQPPPLPLAKPAAPPAPVPKPSPAELAKALTFAQAKPPEAYPVAEPGDNLAGIEKRCLVKAEGARWAAQRRRRLADGATYELEIEPKDREVIQSGKNAGTFLWMNNPSGPCPADFAVMDEVASCFETLASAIAVVRAILNESSLNDDDMAQALALLAEAQCMLRTAVYATGWEKDDPEQSAIHLWLRDATYRHHVFTEFMKATDAVDPAECSGLADRIAAFDRKREERKSTAKKQKSLQAKLRYHVRLIGRGNGQEQDWKQVITSVEELLALGVPPSSLEIREAILPIVERLPDKDYSASFRLVLREIDRYQASQPQQDRQPKEEAINPDIEAVAKLLQGKKVTLIGGYERPASAKAITEAFRLKALNWVRSEEHDSIASFERDVADPEVSLVVLMIRWSSHSYAEVRKFCESYGKPLLRLPGGYSPNQIAHQVLAQCSDRLK